MLAYDDAKIVNKASALITLSKLDSAKILLDEVISRTPDNYSNDYFFENKHYIEFWDADELRSYFELSRDSTIYAIQNAYSRARFWIAWIYFEEGEIQKAHDEIYEAYKLEPDHPTILCYIALTIPEVPFRLALYKRALISREYITPRQKARTYRGLGTNYVEMGDLEMAKNFLITSLKYENNQVAVRELEYIENIIKGGDKGEMKIVRPDTL